MSGFLHHGLDVSSRSFWLLSFVGTPSEVEDLARYCRTIPDVVETYRSSIKLRTRGMEQSIQVETRNPSSASILKLAYHR